jgi:hypothetical protein
MEARLISIEAYDPIIEIAKEIVKAKVQAGTNEVKAKIRATKSDKDRIKYHLVKAEFKPRQHDLGGDKWEIVV